MMLFPDPKTPEVPGIRLECCDIRDLLPNVRGARLIFVDSPWDAYREKPGKGVHPEGSYPCLPYREIREIVEVAAQSCLKGARMVWWETWPLFEEIRAAGLPGKPWVFKTGGGWVKIGSHGPGFHWAGNAESVHIYTLGGKTFRDTSVPLRSGEASKPEKHSAKPFDWQKQMIERWTKPGDKVIEAFAGEAGVARACFDLGREYYGAEIDPRRHARAVGLLANHVSRSRR